jgi:glycogen synthase
VHGFASSARVKELLGASHACIVPTRTNYEAGFEMTCAESILAGRPLITSVVCPAIEYLGPATIEVAPDDPDAYADAIVKLSRDEALYTRLRDACAPLQAQFYDPENSWYAKMQIALSYCDAGRKVAGRPPAAQVAGGVP